MKNLFAFGLILKKFIRDDYRLFVYGAIITVLFTILFIFEPPFFRFLELRFYDTVLRENPLKKPAPDILIVDIDENSLRKFGQWPWPRSLVARMLKEIHASGASAIGVDLLFPETDRTSLSAVLKDIEIEHGYSLPVKKNLPDMPNNDRLLAKTLQAGPFVLANKFLFDGEMTNSPKCVFHPLQLITIKTAGAVSESLPFHKAEGVVCNLPLLDAAVDACGFVNVSFDTDGILRRVPLIIQYDQDKLNHEFFPNFALAVLMKHMKTRQVSVRMDHGKPCDIYLGNITIPVDGNGDLLIHYRNKEKAFSYISASDILTGRLPALFMEGKIVFVGTSAAGLGERRTTPIHPFLPGVEVHATVAQNILQSDFVLRPSWISGVEFLLVLFAGILTTILLIRANAVWSLLLTLAALIGLWSASYLTFRNTGIFISPMISLLTIVANFSILNLAKFWKSEIALRHSEKKYRSIFENSVEGIFRVTPEGRIVSANPAFACTMGFDTPGEMLETIPYIQSIRFEKQDDILSFRKMLSEGGMIRSFETEIYTNKGTKKWISVSARAIKSNENMAMYEGTAVDITEKKQFEEALRIDEARLEALVKINSMDDLPRKEILDYAMEEMVRITKSEAGYIAFTNEDGSVLTMHSWSNKALEDCRLRYNTMVCPLENTGLWAEPVRQRRPVITNDYNASNPLKRGYPRRHFPVKRHMSIPIFAGDRIVLIAGVANKPQDYDDNDIRQITLMMAGVWKVVQRRQIESDLKDSKQRMADIIEFLPDATVVIDKKGEIIAWNHAMEAMTGVKAEDMLGKGDYEYALPFYGERRPMLIDLVLNPNPEMEKRYTAIQRTGDVLFGEAHKLKSIPGNLHFSATASVLKDYKGEVIATIECLRNDTERKKLETQLVQSQKMEAIGTLAGGIAHDFNNILAAVMGNTELIKLNLQQPDLNNYVDRVLGACDRARNMVKQILTFSRHTERELKAIDVSALIKEALKLLHATLPSTIGISSNIAPQVYAILADPTQVYQILMNLCTNAAHAMRDRGGLLEVGLKNSEITPGMLPQYPDLRPGPYVRLTVSDTGTGIVPEIIDNIFDPFFTTKKREEGTGLGLSVVYGIAKEYGGAVHVQTEVGRGSTFSVYLPSIERETELKKDSADVITGGSERILLVDDENILIEMESEILERLGYNVTAILDSLRALELFSTQPECFDLVITDMTMPGMTGSELAKEILKIRPGIPIVLCTGFSELINEDEAKELGIREFIMKPISLKNLADIVRKVLDTKDDDVIS